MKTVIGRFLTFEETLGKGLVKFAYFVLLAFLVAATVVAMIGGVVLMFDDFLEGLWRFVVAPFQLVIAVILLRIGAEVVNAILSIDDQLTDGARAGGRMPSLGSGSGSSSAGSAAPGAKTPIPHGDTEASRPANQEAPFVAGGGSGGSDDADGGGDERGYAAESVSTAPAASSKSSGTAKAGLPPKKKAAKKTTKSAKASRSKAGGAASAAAASSSSSSAAETAEASRRSPASARSDAAKAATGGGDDAD